MAERLDKSDAKYVDVIHTDAGGLGTDLVIGHADYFPNGGRDQPNCIANGIITLDLRIHLLRSNLKQNQT